jgi:hypothetical protein
MNAVDFTNKIKKLTPSKENLVNSGFSNERAKEIIKHYFICNKDNQLEVKSEIVKLLTNYDVSNVEIGMIRFQKDLIESNRYFYFARFELDYLANDKQTDEIVLIDYNSDEFVMCKCALNSSCFLDAVLFACEGLTLFLLDENISNNENYVKQLIEKCTLIAGGNEYFDFYQTFLG